MTGHFYGMDMVLMNRRNLNERRWTSCFCLTDQPNTAVLVTDHYLVSLDHFREIQETVV